MRARRYDAEKARPVTNTAAVPPSAKRWARRTPLTTSNANPISASTMAESRSGSSITSPASSPSMNRTGIHWRQSWR